MISPPPFPISIDQLGVDELSGALGANVVDFTKQRVGADRGMLGEIFRITPSYGPAETGPDSVIAKFASLREGALAAARRGRTNERELRCYDELLPLTKVTTPRFYRGWYDPDTAHFLMIQEAVEHDESVDQVAGLEIGLARLVLQELAVIHHRWWKDPVLDQLGWLPAVNGQQRLDNLLMLAERGWEPLCALAGDDFTAADRALGAEFPDRLGSSLTAVAAFDSTLVHSDIRADNLLFTPDRTKVALIDWQGVSVGPGAFDVAYLLSHSLTVENRRRHEADLLEFYRSELAANGTVLDPQVLRDAYVTSLLYGLVIACALPIISDTNLPRIKPLALSMANRTIEALRDHDQLWEG